MDNAELHYLPDRRFTAAAAVGVVVAAIIAVVDSDGPGRFLAAVVAVVLLGYAVGDFVFSPRVSASADGVVIRSPLTRARLTWDQIDAIRADDRIRLGLRSSTLEIDAGTVFAVLSRRALGADPHAAAEAISALRPAD